MAEMKDITNENTVHHQMTSLANMYELQADYLQDLKRQVKSLNHVGDIHTGVYEYQMKALEKINQAQRSLYEASNEIDPFFEHHHFDD